MLNPRYLLSLVALSLTTAVASAAPGDVQGNVTGPNNKPIAGARVTLQRTDAKGAPSTVQTDIQGRYVFKSVPLTGIYAVTVNANAMASTTAKNVKPLNNGAVRFDFNLKPQTGNTANAAPKPKAKQMVWVPATTGTNIGGRWVEVGGETAPESAGFDNTKRANRGALGSMQGNSGTVKGGD